MRVVMMKSKVPMTFREGSALAALLLAIVEICLACKARKAQQEHSIEENTATINLSAVTNSSENEVFNQVKQASRLPSAVLDELGEIADPGQPFNTTDVVDPSLPMRQLIVAAVSEKHCIVSYWEGGIVFKFETTVFELSEGRVKREWVSIGGGFNFRDLKDTIEVGDLLQFRQVPVTPAKLCRLRRSTQHHPMR
jgi:hypothetical protein